MRRPLHFSQDTVHEATHGDALSTRLPVLWLLRRDGPAAQLPIQLDPGRRRQLDAPAIRIGSPEGVPIDGKTVPVGSITRLSMREYEHMFYFLLGYGSRSIGQERR